MAARGFQQIERADRIDVEIVERTRRGEVVARLGGAMDDGLRPSLLDQSLHGSPVPNVEFVMGEVPVAAHEARLVPARVAGRAEKACPHIVVDAVDAPAGLGKKRHHL